MPIGLDCFKGTCPHLHPYSAFWTAIKNTLKNEVVVTAALFASGIVIIWNKRGVDGSYIEVEAFYTGNVHSDLCNNQSLIFKPWCWNILFQIDKFN